MYTDTISPKSLIRKGLFDIDLPDPVPVLHKSPNLGNWIVVWPLRCLVRPVLMQFDIPAQI